MNIFSIVVSLLRDSHALTLARVRGLITRGKVNAVEVKRATSCVDCATLGSRIRRKIAVSKCELVCEHVERAAALNSGIGKGCRVREVAVHKLQACESRGFNFGRPGRLPQGVVLALLETAAETGGLTLSHLH